MNNSIKCLLVACFTVAAGSVYSQTIQPATLELTTKQQAKSIQFKNMEGQNRIAVFNDLKSLIKTKSATIYSKKTDVIAVSNSQQVIDLFGEPTEKTAPNTWVYVLNNNSGKRYAAVIGLNQTGQVLFCSIADID